MSRETIPLFAAAVAIAAIASVVAPMKRVLIWNASASLPTGLYHLRGTAALHVGERVAIAPAPPLRAFMAARGYLPAAVPLLKEVAALGGSTVCRSGFAVSIDSRQAGLARERDRRGRLLPVWRGCRTLSAGDVFVLNRRASDSFDSRYFGPIARRRIIGRASPVWTDETGTGDHVWFARPTIETCPSPTQGDIP